MAKQKQYDQERLFEFQTQLEGVANYLARDIQNVLSESDKATVNEIIAALAGDLSKNLSVPQAMKRLNELKAKLQTIRETALEKSKERTLHVALKTKEKAETFERDELADLTGRKPDKIKKIPKKDANALLKYQPFVGQSIDEWFSRYKTNDLTRIATAVTQAYAERISIADVRKKIMGTKAGNYQDGILVTSRNSATTLARTIVNGVANEARLETMMANEDVIDGLQFVATLDGRTSFICASLDGTIWKGADMKNAKRPPIHPNCRSTLVPYIEILDENGKPIEQGDRPAAAEDFERLAKELYEGKAKPGSKSWNELSPSTRKKYYYAAQKDYTSRTGKPAYTQVPGKTTFKDYFEKQPESFQRSWLGPKRYELYKEGKLSFESLVKSDTGHVLPVEALRIKTNANTGYNGTYSDKKDGNNQSPPLYKTSKKGIINDKKSEEDSRYRKDDSGAVTTQTSVEKMEKEQFHKYTREKLSESHSSPASDLKKSDGWVEFPEWAVSNQPELRTAKKVKEEIMAKESVLDKEYNRQLAEIKRRASYLEDDYSMSNEEINQKHDELKKEKNALWYKLKEKKSRLAYDAALPIDDPQSPNRRALSIKAVSFAEEQTEEFKEELRKGLDDFGRFADNFGVNIVDALFSDPPGGEDKLVLRADKFMQKGIYGMSATDIQMVWIAQNLDTKQVRSTVFHEMIHWMRDHVDRHIDSSCNELEDVMKKIPIPNKNMKIQGEALSYFMEYFIMNPQKTLDEYYKCMESVLNRLKTGVEKRTKSKNRKKEE